MPLTIIVIRGHTFQPDVPYGADELNAAALPNVSIEGSVSGADLQDGAVVPAKATPGAYFWAGSATGGAGAYAVSLTPAVSHLAAGLWLSWAANHTNSGSATLDVQALGARPLVTQDGRALGGGEIRSGQVVWVQYDGSNWRVVSPRSMPQALYAQDTGAADAYVISLPSVEVSTVAQLLGQLIVFRAGAANTGAATLAVNGLAPVAITKGGASALDANDILAGGLVSVVYDGTSFQLSSFSEAPALPAVGAAGTHVYPYSVTVDAQGRVTGASSGVYSATVAMPASGAAHTFTHGLGRTPSFVRVVAVMGATTELGRSAGDELAIEHPVANYPSGFNMPAFSVTTNATTITVARVAGAGFVDITIGNAAGNAIGNMTPANYTLKCVAW